MNTDKIFRFNPFIAWLNINQACNLRCKGCYAEHTGYSPKQEMSLGMAKHLVELSLEIGVKEFVLIGATSFQLILCTPTFCGEAVSTDFVIPPANIWEDLSFLSQNIERLYGAENVNYDTQMPLCLFPKEFVARKLSSEKLQSQCHVFSRSGVNFDFRGNVLFCNTIAEIVARYGVDFTDAKSLIYFMSSEQKRAEYRQVLRYPSQRC